MKCRFVLDVDMDTSAMPEAEKAKLKFRKCGFRLQSGGTQTRLVPYFPKGTDYEHPDAHILVRNGLAVPADDECTKACAMTPEEQEKAQAAYKVLDAGILPEDRPLYDAGVIEGYDANSPDGYKHGKNWDAYAAAMKEMEEESAKALTGDEEPAVVSQSSAPAAEAPAAPPPAVEPPPVAVAVPATEGGAQ